MVVTQDISLKDFEFWSGGREMAKWFTDEEMDTIESAIEEFYPDGIDETRLNELFWFDNDWLASLVGFEDADDLISQRRKDGWS